MILQWHFNNFVALVIRRTVLHDLSVLAIRRTMQINSLPMEIIICFLKQKVAICVVMSLISTNQTTYTRVTVRVRGLWVKVMVR